MFFANAGVSGAKDKKTLGAKLVGDIETGEFLETLRINTLRCVSIYQNPFFSPRSLHLAIPKQQRISRRQICLQSHARLPPRQTISRWLHRCHRVRGRHPLRRRRKYILPPSPSPNPTSPLISAHLLTSPPSNQRTTPPPSPP